MQTHVLYVQMRRKDKNMLQTETDFQYDGTLNPRRRMSRINMAFFALIFVSQLSGILIDSVVQAFFPDFTQSGSYSYIMSALSFYVFGAGACCLILRRVQPCSIEKKTMPAGELVKLTIMAWGLMIAGSVAGNIVNALIGALTGVYSSNYVSSSIQNSGWLSAFLYTVVIAPVVEELVCRKLLVSRTSWLGDAGAIIMCGLVFGLFHGNLYQFFYAFAVGMLFGYVYLQTGELKYTIIIHMIMNFLGGFLPLLLTSGLGNAVSVSPEAVLASGNQGQILKICIYMIYVLFEYALAIAGIVLLILNFKTMRTRLRPWTIPEGGRARTLLGNAGGVLMLASALAVMAYTYMLS